MTVELAHETVSVRAVQNRIAHQVIAALVSAIFCYRLRSGPG